MSTEGFTPAPPRDDIWAPPPTSSAGMPADWWPRVGAATIDFFVRLGIVAVCAVVGLLGLLGGEDTGEIGIGAGVILGTLIGYFVYAPLMMARSNGQTVGHRVTDTRVVMADGSRISGGRAFVREALVKNILIEFIGAFTFCVLTIVNYLMPLWNDNNETLHDKMCKTRVVIA